MGDLKQGVKNNKNIKKPLNQIIYLPDYFIGTISRSFQEEANSKILYWDFGKEADETIKLQMEKLLNYVVETVKNKEERRNRYLLPLKYLLCCAENSGLQFILNMARFLSMARTFP